MKKSILALALILVGTGVYAQTIHPMDEMFKTWIGVKVKEAVKYWGNPSDIEYDQSQTKYQWKEVSTRFIPGTQFQEKTECERILIVDTTGLIVYGKYKGNGCPFTTEGVKKWNYPKSK